MNFVLMFWDETLISLFALMAAVSCVLHLNNGCGGWCETALVYAIGMGALAIGVSPWFGQFVVSSKFELLYVAGTSTYAVYLTRAHWLELVGDAWPKREKAKA